MGRWDNALFQVRNITLIVSMFVDDAAMYWNKIRIFICTAAAGGLDGKKKQANPKSSSTRRDYGIPPAQVPNIGSVRGPFKDPAGSEVTCPGRRHCCQLLFHM